jgi:hypothetical protein
MAREEVSLTIKYDTIIIPINKTMIMEDYDHKMYYSIRVSEIKNIKINNLVTLNAVIGDNDE